MENSCYSNPIQGFEFNANVQCTKNDGPSFCYVKGQTRGSYKVLTGNSSRKKGEMGEIILFGENGGETIRQTPFFALKFTIYSYRHTEKDSGKVSHKLYVYT